MLKLVNKYKLEIGGGVIGAIAGWCYWLFVGCASGSCFITSNPTNSTIYGTILGTLAFSLLKPSTNKIDKQ